MQSYSENVRFGERDREILKFVSQQLAAAIEHKRYEEALRRSEARYRSLILSAAFGIYRCTLGGRFLDVNPALITMLGYGSVEEVFWRSTCAARSSSARRKWTAWRRIIAAPAA